MGDLRLFYRFQKCEGIFSFYNLVNNWIKQYNIKIQIITFIDSEGKDEEKICDFFEWRV